MFGLGRPLSATPWRTPSAYWPWLKTTQTAHPTVDKRRGCCEYGQSSVRFRRVSTTSSFLQMLVTLCGNTTNTSPHLSTAVGVRVIVNCTINTVSVSYSTVYSVTSRYWYCQNNTYYYHLLVFFRWHYRQIHGSVMSIRWSW